MVHDAMAPAPAQVVQERLGPGTRRNPHGCSFRRAISLDHWCEPDRGDRPSEDLFQSVFWSAQNSLILSAMVSGWSFPLRHRVGASCARWHHEAGRTGDLKIALAHTASLKKTWPDSDAGARCGRFHGPVLIRAHQLVISIFATIWGFRT
jgi:hypothetical protein